MKSTFKLTLAIALCLGSSQALALQLGQIRVKSALDERLVAEIPIQLDNLGEMTGLSVGLASDAEFARAGLSRAGLEQLRFSVVSDSTGHKIVLVTSEQPITDPYLDFLVQVNTARGKQLREYTVLLDPVIAAPVPQVTAAPTTAPVAESPAPAATPLQQPAATVPPPSVSTAPVQPARPTASAPLRTPAPTAPAAQPAAPAAPVPAPAPAAASPQPRSNEYHVQRGDTLYHIATETRPDAQVSVDQMMLALQQANPDAFYQDNINRLKSGAILRIPTRDKVDATSAAEARAQVRRQMEDWRGAAARKATTVVQNNPAPAAPAQPTPPQATASDRLALVPPSQGGGGAASRPGEKGGTGTAEIAGLKQQLATAKESLASLKQENGDLQSRVKDLEDISSNNKKLLDMKDAEIAELQRKLAEAQQQAATPAAAPAGNVAPVAPAGSAATPPSSASVASATAPASPATAAAPKAGVAPAASAAPVSAQPARTVKPTVKSATQGAQNQGIAEPWYRKPLTWIIAGVVILGLILLGLVRRRPKPLPEPESDQAPDAGHSSTAAVAETTEEPVHGEEYAAPVAEATQGTEEYHFNFDDVPPEEPPAAPEVATPEPQPEADSGDTGLVEGAVDVASEPEQPGVQPGPQEPDFQAELEEANFQSGPEAEEEPEDEDITREHPVPAFSDDPVDTKLDLARAYLDMGDPEGARAMLEEVLNEGSQMQKDEARRLLEGVA
jgi:pilus assembly protein FimV